MEIDWSEVLSQHIFRFQPQIVSEFWRCPCCIRRKEEIVREVKGELYIKIVRHHDHFGEMLTRDVIFSNLNYGLSGDIVRGLFSRFESMYVCEDCNNCDTRAKRMVGAYKHFSFSPLEIFSFCRPENNMPRHGIDKSQALNAYECARSQLSFMTDEARRLRDIIAGDWDASQKHRTLADFLVSWRNEIKQRYSNARSGL